MDHCLFVSDAGWRQCSSLSQDCWICNSECLPFLSEKSVSPDLQNSSACFLQNAYGYLRGIDDDSQLRWLLARKLIIHSYYTHSDQVQ